MTWIKICGTTSVEDAALAVGAGADAVGLIFAPSKRQITPEVAREIVETIPADVEKVGVFVNEAPERVAEIAGEVGLTVVQLHGDEDAGYLSQLLAMRGQFRILKAVAVKSGTEVFLEDLLQRDLIDSFLLDSAPYSEAEHRGGSGRTFNWEEAKGIVDSVRKRIHVVVGGGLSPANVECAIRRLQPWGVDVCSGVELEPGKKDPGKVKAFVTAARAAAQGS